jgi:hypothetical protein
MDDVICEGWDDSPHYARDNQTHQNGPQEYAVITKNVVDRWRIVLGRKHEGWLTAKVGSCHYNIDTKE